MNFRTINTVIAREYLTKVKKKSFLLTTFLVPVIMAAAIVVMVLVMTKVGDRAQSVAVIDQSGIAMPYLVSDGANTYVDFSGEDPESFKNRLEEFDMDVLVVVSPMDTASKSVSVQAYSRKPLGVDFASSVGSKVDDAVEAYRINSYGIDNLGQIMKDVRSDVKVTEYTLDDSGKETVSESGIYMAVSMILGIFIFMFITLFGGMVMSSVIEEKASRVVEVLISSAKSTELMFGKIIGVALVALTQFLLWIILTLVIVTAVSGFFGDRLKTLSDPQQISQMTQMTQGMGVDAGALENLGVAAADTASVAAPAGGEMGVVVTTLANIPWGTLIVSFFLFFIFGYLLYASLFAAIGSAVENEADTQQLQIPLTIPLMVAYMIVFVAFRNPDGPVAFWGSMIPFTSPIVMLARIPYGVPFWQLALSIVLLILTFVACAWLSAKIYKVGILMYGKKSTFKDLWKWLKQN
ncbi:MAG: ABC transporter permease [Bacteroidales bacterium]|nr:ABC transporter permease [Bacteroidales bacterium]